MGDFEKVVLFLSLLRQRLLGRCYAAKPSFNLIGWLHSIFGNDDYITNRSGVRPAQNAGLMRMRRLIQSTWLDLEVWQSTSSIYSSAVRVIYRIIWQMANSNKKTLSKNLTQMKVRYHTINNLANRIDILNEAHYTMNVVYEETIPRPYRQALGRLQCWSSH